MTQFKTLYRLYQVWRRFPELRLGQLIENALSVTDDAHDVFYVTDATLVKHLEAFGAKHGA